MYTGLLALEDHGTEFQLWCDEGGVWNVSTTWDFEAEGEDVPSYAVSGRGASIGQSVLDAVGMDDDSDEEPKR